MQQLIHARSTWHLIIIQEKFGSLKKGLGGLFIGLRYFYKYKCFARKSFPFFQYLIDNDVQI